MFSLENPLVKLYATLIGWILLGFVLGKLLPRGSSSNLGRFLFYVGTPLSTVVFMRKANLSGQILVAPLTAWVAILVGAAFAWIWIELGVSDERIKASALGSVTPNSLSPSGQLTTSWSSATQGSFLLAMMIGNTGFLGFPVILSLVGPEQFAWALFYDLLGNAMGTNLLGIAIAAHYGKGSSLLGIERWLSPIMAIAKNPSLWAFGIGFLLRYIPLTPVAEDILQKIAWTIIPIFLIMIGMQLSSLKTLSNLKQGFTCLVIKMILTPLVVGTILMFFGLTGSSRLALVLLMGMPPGFGTTLLAETYELDRNLAVTTIAAGCVTLLFTIPLWMWIFGTN